MRGKQQNNRNTEVQQKQMLTYMETNYLLTTAIFLAMFKTYRQNDNITSQKLSTNKRKNTQHGETHKYKIRKIVVT